MGISIDSSCWRPNAALVQSTCAACSELCKWCTFLPSGVYLANVEVSESEHRDGLQYFPLSHKISVAHAPVSGIVFSQLKATVQGQVVCAEPVACASLRVTLRPLAPDGSYVGRPIVTNCIDGKYKFNEVLPGSVEVSVPTERLCWAEARHNVAVTAAIANVPPFQHIGYALRFLSSHAVQVEFESGNERGTLAVQAGASQHCVPRASRYTLTPRGCHRFSPETYTAKVIPDKETPAIQINALSHAVGVKVFSPEQVDDLILRVESDRQAGSDVGPLQPVPATASAGGYVYEHTLYLAQGEVAVVSARSARLLFSPREPQQLIGGAECRPDALQLNAVRGLTLAGRLIPPVPDTDITLTIDDGSVELSQRTGEDGTYRFGPLDAGRQYTVRAHKDSYVFSAPDDRGDIFAHKLAEITVLLLDRADGKPLQGALVSVSGGSYRRNLQTGEEGQLTFPSLAPAEYYVKPLMKEYRFEPPHKIVAVEEGHTHSLTLRGVRIAWSALGTLVSVGGVGWSGATLVATPQPAHGAHCAHEEATTDAAGAFRIRGLLPKCKYTVVLKEATTPELQGLKLAKMHTLQIEEPGNDIEDIRLVAVQSQQLTDASVLVRAHIDHYKTLRLRLDLDTTESAGRAGGAAPLFSVRLDSTGYSATLNPGLMYVLPRLPADNRTYVVQLESTLSKTTHTYTEPVLYFTSDGHYKHFTIDFEPKVKSLEQELRQTSLLVIPLVGLLVLAVVHRDKLLGHLLALGSNVAARAQQKTTRPSRPEILDKNSIEQILNSVNAAGKRTGKQKKVQ
ncbi:Nodal modulator 1 [Eumeta japonica]|uniref:Nodal modulator 1 n=1 Tax=Eumeta variegata TaxID=151549 RepID=A0A4C1VKC2_EUMVA|nr:Nodal modulator 1 [Eumeta japonica]